MSKRMSERVPDARAMEKYMRGYSDAQGQEDFESATQGSAGTVSQERAGYMTPDQGPFMCGNCVHFSEPSSCNLVAGEVEAEGVCDLFEPSGGQDVATAEQMEGPAGGSEVPVQGL